MVTSHFYYEIMADRKRLLQLKKKLLLLKKDNQLHKGTIKGIGFTLSTENEKVLDYLLI